VAVGVARLALGGVAKETRDVRAAFHVGLLGEVQITPVGLALAGERGLEVLVGLAVLEIRHACCLLGGGSSCWRIILQNGFAPSS